MKTIFTIGVSASGKSYWAEHFVKENPNYVIIERDQIRKQILQEENIYKEGFLWKIWNFKNEHIVDKRIDTLLEKYVSEGKDIIFSNTNLNKKYLDKNIKEMESHGYTTKLKYFPVDYETAIQRDKKRTESVGIDVIDKQWFQWLQFPRDCIEIPEYIKDTSKPKAVVCDIDGTVAKMVNRNPYDFGKAGTDEPIKEILNIIDMYRRDGFKIIFLSGRDSISRDVTTEWLNKHFGGNYLLYMRAEGDTRKDRIAKQELFFNHVSDNWNVEVVIDDRKQVVRLWTDLGCKLLNVGNYYETF
jgi:predicted kinase